MRKRNLLILCGHFPPHGTAGGSIRVVKLLKYLGKDWKAHVLTATGPGAGAWDVQPGSSATLAAEVPPSTVVYRTRVRAHRPPVVTGADLFPGRSSRRHGIFLPDRRYLWVLRTAIRGLRLCRRIRVDTILVTAPPASALWAAYLVSKLSGIPLVVEFRDEILNTAAFDSMPRSAQRAMVWIQEKAVRHCHSLVTVTKTSHQAFRDLYSSLPEGKFHMIPNGCDVEEFRQIRRPPRAGRSFVILNAGGYAPGYRDATPFWRALLQLFHAHPELRSKVRVDFIGEGARSYYPAFTALLQGVFREVPVGPRADYISRLKNADLTLLIQARGFPRQVAGTLFEYWGAGNAPVLMIGEEGEMWDLVEHHRIGTAVRFDDVDGIRSALWRFISSRGQANMEPTDAASVGEFDRRALAKRMEDVLAGVSR